MERATNARRRGALDVAMIGLMRDARLRVSEAAVVDLGRPGAGARRVRPRARRRNGLPRGERRHDESCCRRSAGARTRTSRFWA